MYKDLLEDTKKNLKQLVEESGIPIDSLVKSLLSPSSPVLIPNTSLGSFNGDSNKDFGEELRNHWLYEKQSIQLGLTPSSSPKEIKELNQTDQVEICVLAHLLNEIHQATLSLNKTSNAIIENVIEQMVTKKTYKIRQNFRELILDLLEVKEFMFYSHHESGRIEFQDFSSNFITEIIECEPKYNLFSNNQEIPTNFEFEAFKEGSVWLKLFEINSVEINEYFGITIQKGQNSQSNSSEFFFMVKAKEFEKVKKILTPKLLKKIIEICEINISDGSQYIISKNYAIKMLDLLEYFILQYETALKKSLIDTCKMGKESYHSVDSIIKVALSKIDENMANEELILKIRKSAEQIEETQYKKIEEIRLYKKYLRQHGTTLLEFNRVGVLLFMSGNHDNSYLNTLTEIWREGKPVLDSLFGENKVLDDQIKKAIKGTCNSERLFEIGSSVKAKIVAKGKRIEKIQIFVEDEETSLPNTPNDCSNIDTISSQFDKSEKLAINILKELEKENPGIKNEGWIDLFLKNTIKNHRRKSASMAQKENNNSGLHEKAVSKLLRVSSCTVSKEVYHCLDGISLDNPNLNFLIFTDIELESFAIRLFESLEYFQRLPREMNKLQNFISDLHDNYEIHSNPFHNFKHGINVMHSCYLLSNLSSNFNILNKKDIFINVFSGLCHDVGHTGFTNAFEIASMSRKAMMYNDKSPLENFHASLTFELLRKEENNFLCHMSKEEFNVFRKGVIENILFTDIKEHFPLLNRFNDLVKSGKTLRSEDAPLVSCMIIHSGDFAGSIKDFEICKEWSMRVNQEFSKQYTVEGELGLPQSPFMKDVTNPLVFSKGEGGFLKVIVYPLYEALDSFYMTETFIHERKKNIENNIKEWEEMYAIESEKDLKAKSK